MTFQVPLCFYFQRKKSQFVIHTCNLLGRIKEHRPFGLRKDTKNLFSFKDKNTKIKIEFNSRASSLKKKKPTAINFITNHSMVQINRKMAVKFYLLPCSQIWCWKNGTEVLPVSPSFSTYI